jgi:hypothetical protein
MSLDQVAAGTTIALKLPPRDADPGLVQPSVPHQLSIPHPEHGLELPPGLFTLIDAREHVVRIIRSSPHIDYVTPAQATRLLREIDDHMRQRGWRRLSPRDDAPLSPTLEDRDTVFAVLMGGDWTTELRARIVHRATSESGRHLQLEDDGCLVTLVVAAT